MVITPYATSQGFETISGPFEMINDAVQTFLPRHDEEAQIAEFDGNKFVVRAEYSRWGRDRESHWKTY